MILSDETSDCGERRIYFTQMASVVSYFTEDGDGGVAAHARPSEFACPWSTTTEKLEAVKMSMLEETARRLHCRVDQVALMTMADIAQVCEPHLTHRHTWVGRSKIKPRGGR